MSACDILLWKTAGENTFVHITHYSPTPNACVNTAQQIFFVSEYY